MEWADSNRFADAITVGANDGSTPPNVPDIHGGRDWTEPMPFVWEDEQSGEDILAMWNWPGCAQRALCLCLYRSLRMRLCRSVSLHLPLSACLSCCRHLLLAVGLKCLLPPRWQVRELPAQPSGARAGPRPRARLQLCRRQCEATQRCSCFAALTRLCGTWRGGFCNDTPRQ